MGARDLSSPPRAATVEHIRHRLNFLSYMGVGRNGELSCTCLANAAAMRKRRSNPNARDKIRAAKIANQGGAAPGAAASGASSSSDPML